jgi:GDP-4-dehydro-6-deoxy-D-mannose reductase
MARILITGAAGMIGSHLMEMLADRGETDVVGSYHLPTIDIGELRPGLRMLPLDVRDADAVGHAIEVHRPSVIYHLAAQSLPTVSWAAPWATLHTNVQGTVNVFEAVKQLRAIAPGYDPMVVVACSSAQYGASLGASGHPVREDVTPLPMHPYGVSKVAQDLLAYQYFCNDGIRSIRARIFNCTGPRKRADVVSDFAARVARIMRGADPELQVGNLSARRAIIDVRDLVGALMLLVEHGDPGEAYNICADDAHRIGDLIPLFEQLAGTRLHPLVDPRLLRPTDEACILGSTDRLKQRTGWRQEIPLVDTMKSVLDYELAHLDA